MIGRLSFVVGCLIALGARVSVASEEVDTRSIKEAWGEDASIANCFKPTAPVGIGARGAEQRSNMAELVKTETMTF